MRPTSGGTWLYVYAPQTPTGAADAVNGIVPIAVGTGGRNHYRVGGDDVDEVEGAPDCMDELIVGRLGVGAAVGWSMRGWRETWSARPRGHPRRSRSRMTLLESAARAADRSV